MAPSHAPTVHVHIEKSATLCKKIFNPLVYCVPAYFCQLIHFLFSFGKHTISLGWGGGDSLELVLHPCQLGTVWDNNSQFLKPRNKTLFKNKALFKVGT